MNRILVSALLTLSLVCCAPVRAEFEIGLNAQTGWSNNFHLGHPKGWGICASKSLLPVLSVRVSYGRFGNSLGYFGVMQFGVPFPGMDTTRELIDSDATVDMVELSLSMIWVDGSKMRFETGSGLGTASFELHLNGHTTGRTWTREDGGLMATVYVDVLIKQFIAPPLGLRLGYQYRGVSPMGTTTCTYEPFGDVTLSSVRAAVVARW